MPVELDQCSCVVLGMWNPGIITPKWLKQEKILPKIPKEGTLGFQPLSRAIRFELDEMIWEISDSRLSVTSKTCKNCGRVVAEVLKILPHTPLQAIGTNFVYKGSVDAWKSDLVPKMCSLRLTDGKPKGLAQVTWGGVLDLDKNTLMNLSVTNGAAGVIVAFNLHRNCSTATTASEFAVRWESDLKTVTEILRNEFGVKV